MDEIQVKDLVYFNFEPSKYETQTHLPVFSQLLF